MEIKELRIDTFSNSSSEVVIRITHMPTGTTVSGEGVGRYRLREKLMRELEEKLNNLPGI